MNSARFSLSGDRLSGSDRTLDSTNPWCLHNSSNLGLKRLRCVISELIDTEQNYVQSICDLDQGYLAQLRQDPGVDPSVLDMIFGQIGDLRVFHEQILLSLQLYREDLIQLARVFLKNASQFENLYVDFCINYCKSIRALQEARQMRTILWNKLVTCQQNLGHQLPVETYLLKPVQRVLKYQLLLQECVKHCMSAIHSMTDDKPPSRLGRAASSSNGLDVTESEFDLLQHLNEAVPVLGQALERMIKVADHINEKKRCREVIDQLRSMRIDVDSWGDLVLRGHFRIPGKKDLRLILLFHRAILLCKYTSASPSAASSGVGVSSSADQLWFSGASPGTTELASSNSSLSSLGHAHNGTAIQIREVISCANLMLVECIPKYQLAFHILPFDNPKAQRTLQAPTLEVKRLWCREIKRLILENYDAAIPEKAKHIVLNMAEWSTARGLLLDGAGDGALATIGVESDHGCIDRLNSRSCTTCIVKPPDRASVSGMNMLQTEPVCRSGTGQRKHCCSDTTDCTTRKHSSTCSRLDAQSSLLESSPSKSISKVPTHASTCDATEGDSTDGLDSVFHDVWNKIWSKHSHSSNQTNSSATSPSSPEASKLSNEPQESPSTGNGPLCDTDADFRCIAVEINEERLGVCVASTADVTGSPTTDAITKPPVNGLPISKSTGLLNQHRIEQTRHHKAPAPRPPDQSTSSSGSSNSSKNSNCSSNLTTAKSSNNNSNANTLISTPPASSRDRSRISSVYIDCPNASCYDVTTFGRAYEHYIAKARAQVALSPRDLDEIFSPLRQLVHPDSLDASVRAATVPLPGNAEAIELRQRLNGERAATTDRDPFFYRRTSPAQPNYHLRSTSIANEFLAGGPPDGTDDADNSDGASSQSSSVASSPRHLVSRIAVSHSQNVKTTDKLAKTTVKSRNNSATIGVIPTTPKSTSTFFERGETNAVDSEANLEQNGFSLTTNCLHATTHAGLLSTPRRRKSIQSAIDSPSGKPAVSSYVQPNGASVNPRLKPELYVPVNGSGGSTQMSSRLNKCLDESSLIQTEQLSSNKFRSPSFGNREHKIGLPHTVDLPCVPKNSSASTENLSPSRGRSASLTDTCNERVTRRIRRKSRAAPAPPQCPVGSPAPFTTTVGSDHAPLAESEGVINPEQNMRTESKDCHGQLKATTTHVINGLPYADDSSAITGYSPRSSLLSSAQAVQTYEDQPVKPPRRVTLQYCSTSPPINKQLNSTCWTRPTTKPPLLHLHSNLVRHCTRGLSQSTRTSSPCTGIDYPPRRGIVRNMIDRFQQ